MCSLMGWQKCYNTYACRTGTARAVFRTWQSCAPEVSPHHSLPPLIFFCLIMSGGSNDQREGAKQIKASAVAEATPRIKGPMAVPARVGTTVVFPWHDTLKATGATPHRWTPRHAGPSSCSGGLPAKKQVCTLPCSLTAFNTNKILHYY